MGRTLRSTSVAPLAAALAVVAGPACREKATAPATEQPITLAPENVAVVEERTLLDGPEVSGRLRARREASLRAEVAGTVIEVPVDAGERVRAGQVLARVEDAALQDSLLAARSVVSAAQNGLAVAEANARRAHTLAAAGAMAAQQAEQADALLETARAQLADARARLALAEQQAGKARVRAPFAGVISLRQVSAGDVVAPGAALFTLIDPSRLQFEGSFPAARLGEVKPGMTAIFTVTGFGDAPFEGEIARMAPAVDPATGLVRVYVEVPNDDGRLISGLYAQGRVAARHGRALAAPLGAVDVTSTPPTVMRVVEGRVERVAVQIGIRDEAADAVALTAGVSAGDVLVLGSAREGLSEGAPVRVARGRVGRRPPEKAD